MKIYKTYKNRVVSQHYSQHPIFTMSPNPIGVQAVEEVIKDYSKIVAEELTSAYVTHHTIECKELTYNTAADKQLKATVSEIEKSHRESFIGPHKKPAFVGPQRGPIQYDRKGHIGNGGCIIDFIGFADDLPENDFTAMNYAKSIAKEAGHRKTFTLNQVAVAIAKRSTKLGDGNFALPKGESKPSKAQKNILRYNGVEGTTLNPDMVVIITPPKADDPTEYISVEGTGSASNGKDPFGTGEYLRLSSEAKKAAEAWAEVCNNNVHVVQAYRQDLSRDRYPIFRVHPIPIFGIEHNEMTKVIHYTPSDLFPEYANVFAICEHDDRNRRCADTWASALDYSFSSPLYANECKVKNSEFFTKRNGLGKEQAKLFDACREQGKHIRIENKDNPEIIAQRLRKLFNTFKGQMSILQYNETAKPTSSKSKFNLYNRTAPDTEVADFWNYQAALYKLGQRDKNLAAGYTICPECGRPVLASPTSLDIFETAAEKDAHFGMTQCRHCDTWFETKLDCIADSFSFDENRDTEDKSSEMRTAGDDTADSMFETLADIDDDSFEQFDEITKVNSSMMQTFKGIPNIKTIIIEEKKSVKAPKIFTARCLYQTLSFAPVKRKSGTIVRRNAR